MKTALISRSIGLGVALLSLAALPGQSQEFSPADVRSNQAVARSPRALEAFPELARPAAARPVRTATVAPKVAALNANPRALEDFEALARPARAEARTQVAGARTGVRLWDEPLPANPRTLEDLPALARQATPAGAEPEFQVAPLK